MNITVWNCRGLGQRLTVRRLKELQRLYLPDMLFLMETKQSDNYVRDLGVRLGFQCMQIVSPQGLSGGLAVFWKDSVSVSCLSSDSRLVDLLVEYKMFKFYLSCVYGHPIPRLRHYLWEKLQRLSTARQGPWMLCGDFNEIKSSAEKRGGNTRPQSSFRDFRLMLDVCEMSDLPFKGNPFSWVGHTRGGIVECCLDKALVNTEWQQFYPASAIEFLDLAESDHRPMIVSIADEVQSRRGQFRYDKRLFAQDAFADMITRFWRCSSVPREDFFSNLVHCRSVIAKWKRTHRLNAAENIIVARRRMDFALRDPTVVLSEIQQLQRELTNAYNDEETFWRLKSRMTWLKCGERNTAYFHGVTRARRPRNFIKSLKDDAGLIHTQDRAIARVAENHFSAMFTATRTLPLDAILPRMERRVTADMNMVLTRSIDDDEIKHAAFLLGPDKSPGHDGFSAVFYHQFWEQIGPQVCTLVKRFFRTGVMDAGVNHTNLCLIPKTSAASVISDYRPISLCTVTYKIISKLMVLRLKTCLGSIISDNQAAFVPGRQISDNILVAHELLHALRSKVDCASTYLAIKTDISKAYDRVEWDFLENVMLQLGFHCTWVRWVMSCVRSTSYSILVNGQAYGRFVPTRGIRQGDPLSPYLFLFCAETLSQMIFSAVSSRALSGMRINSSCPAVSHLLFADDSLFFCKASPEDCTVMARIFREYESVSGQQVNLLKSSIIFGNKIPDAQRQLLMNIMGIMVTGGGGKYLGLPEQFGRTKVDRFQHLIQRVKDCVSHWYNQFLSPAGKEILIKSIAQAIPVYSMSCFLLPKTVCSAINRILSAFWWGTADSGRRKISWIAWSRLSLPKREGGLGFKDLYAFNVALLGKQAWRVWQNPHSLLARIYKGRYHKSEVFLDSVGCSGASYGWQSLQVGKVLLKKGLRSIIGTGLNTKLWTDYWLPVLPLRLARCVVHNPNSTDLVARLFIPGSREWCATAITNLLAPEDAQVISTMRLSRVSVDDRLVWAYTTNGAYTVKSGYWVETHCRSDQDDIAPPGGSLSLKCQVWSLPIPSKIRHFLWRSIVGALPSAERLASRQMQVNTTCQRCCVAEETIQHLLFSCPFSQAVWRCANIPIANNPNWSLEQCFQELFCLFQQTQVPPLQRVLCLWIPWSLWKSRNRFLFAKQNVAPQLEVSLCTSSVEEWLMANPWPQPSRRHRLIPNPLPGCWNPPPIHWLHCSFDCSFQVMADYMGVGWLIRSHTGGFIEAGSARLPRVCSALEAEACSFLFVLQHIWCRGWRQVWFEGDNKTLVDLINTGGDNVEVANLLVDIRSWCARLPHCSLAFTGRDCNQAADILAKFVNRTSSMYNQWFLPPVWLMPYLYNNTF